MPCVKRLGNVCVAGALLWMLASCGGGEGGPCYDGCIEQDLTIYQGLGVPIADGDEVEWQYGFQGGVMIRPRLV